MQGAGPTRERAVTTTEQGGNSPEYPGQALVTVNSNQSTDQEYKGTLLWTTLTHQGADTSRKTNYTPALFKTETTNRRLDKMRWQRNRLWGRNKIKTSKDR